MTANRIAALGAGLAGLAGFIAGLAQVLPGTWPNVALAGAGLLTKLGVVLSYLDGSKKFDALEAQRLLAIFANTGELEGKSEGVKAADFEPAPEPTPAAPVAAPTAGP